MPPPAAAEVAVAQLVVLLLLLVLLPLALLELDDELQAAVSSRPLATAAVAAMRCLARTISLPNHSPRGPGTKDAKSWLDKSRSWLAKTNGRYPADGVRESVTSQVGNVADLLRQSPIM